MDVEPGAEAVDVRDSAPEIDRIANGLTRGHPTYERMESRQASIDEVRDLVRELSSVEVMDFPPGS